MARKKNSSTEEVDVNEIKEKIRVELDKQYGGVMKFLNSEEGKKLGGIKVRVYLYKGVVNFDVLNKFCKFLGIGELSRNLVITRTYTYSLTTPV